MPTADGEGLTVGPGLVLVAVGAAIAQLFRASVPWNPSYRALFEEMAVKYGLDENLLHALAWHESHLNPLAVGPVNTNGSQDFGLMQVNNRNFPALGLNSATWSDPRANVEAAAKLLQGITRTPGLSIADVISIYNAGARADGTPHRTPAGGYVNPAYVAEAYGQYLAVAAAALAPVRG